MIYSVGITVSNLLGVWWIVSAHRYLCVQSATEGQEVHQKDTGEYVMRDKNGYKEAYMEDGVILACRSTQALNRAAKYHKRAFGPMKSWFSKEPENYLHLMEAYENVKTR